MKEENIEIGERDGIYEEEDDGEYREDIIEEGEGSDEEWDLEDEEDENDRLYDSKID
jgi:hypothetical protein